MNHIIYSYKTKKPITITLLSDIHHSVNSNMDFLNRQCDKLLSNPTDYTFILGDIVDNAKVNIKDLCILREYLYKLAKTNSEIIAILGNHDMLAKNQNKQWESYYNEEYIDMLRNIPNFNLLENNYFLDNDVLIYGTEFSGDFYENKEPVGEFLQSIEKIKFFDSEKRINILLNHSPYRILDEDILRHLDNLSLVDLICAGHFHNGGIPPYISDLLPGNLGLIDPYKNLFPKNARGHRKLFNDSIGVIASPVNASDNKILRKIYQPREELITIKPLNN